MSPAIPAYEAAKRDPALRDVSLSVYLHLLDSLDPVEFREVKRAALASHFALSERAIQRALKKLTQRGYLRASRPQPGSARKYRLVYSMPA